MKPLLQLLLFTSALAVPAVATTDPPFTDDLLTITSMTTEYLTDPLGVDVTNPRISWKIQCKDSAARGIYQSSYQIKVSNSKDQWLCHSVQSSQNHLVPLFGDSCEGFALESDTQYHWQVTVQVVVFSGQSLTATSPTASFRTGLLEDSDWKADWITGGNEYTFLHADFKVAPIIQSHATLFVSGVGYYEAYLNGAKVGDHVLDVGWTDYRKRVWYATYNVTELLLPNASSYRLGVLLGNGWWSCGLPPGTGQPQCRPKDPPQVKLQLQVDGKVVLTSNADAWRAGTSPIVYNSLYNGEIYNATMEDYYYEEEAQPVSLAHSVVNKAQMTSQLFEPIRHVSTRPPVSITILNHNKTDGLLTQVVDFGQNQAAVTRLKKIHCARGANVTLRHAEVLTHPPYGPEDGSIYVANLRSAKAADVYICKGDPKGESYTPTFTQHGYRYVEVTGLDYPLQTNDIEAVEVRTDVRITSSLQFSNPLLNQIQDMCVWGAKSNLMSLPTDCPNRDERRGWMGDAALAAELTAYNFGMGALYSRWLLQIVDAQNTDGSVPDYVPILDQDGHAGAPNWQSAFPTIVWVLYKYYGDIQVISQHHDALVHYYDFLENQYKNKGIQNFRQGYGDWCPPPPHPKSNKHLMGAFALIHDLQQGVDIFSASKHPDAAQQVARLKGMVSKYSQEFHVAFFNTTTGLYGSGLQTEQALPLSLGAVPTYIHDQVVAALVKDIQETQSGHTTSGIVGIKFGMEILSALGHSDVALDLALQKTYPSWGFMVGNEDEPATTVWELWNGHQNGPNMNSRNHIMFGTVSSWFYKYLAGIQPKEAGYWQISIRPSGQSTLDHASATIATPFGDIASAWTRRETHPYQHRVSLPAGTNATLLVPIPSDNKNPSIAEGGNGLVWENGQFALNSPGVISGEEVANGVEFQLLNGNYEFFVLKATEDLSVTPQ